MPSKEQLTEILETFGAQLLRSIAQNPLAVVTAITNTTIRCKPVVNRVVNGEKVELPEFIEVPVIHMYGGENYTAHPVAVGDHCILMISERCFDLWFEGQDFKPPAEFRVHDYSDAFALFGPRRRADGFTIPTDGRTWSIGNTYFEGEHEHVGDLTRTGDETVTGNRTQDGDTEITGNHDAGSYSVGGTAGWSGTFATGDSRVVTVEHGIITQVV